MLTQIWLAKKRLQIFFTDSAHSLFCKVSLLTKTAMIPQLEAKLDWGNYEDVSARQFEQGFKSTRKNSEP